MKQVWSTDELARCWHLSPKERLLLKTKPLRNHLAFAAQLKYYQNTGHFVFATSDLPDFPVRYLAKQLKVDHQQLKMCDWRSRTSERHRMAISAFLGIRRIEAKDKDVFLSHLVETAYPNGTEISTAFDLAFEWFQQNKIACPAKKELSRLVRSAYQKFEDQLYENITAGLSGDAKKSIDDMLDASSTVVHFNDIKADPGRIGLDSVLKEVGKLSFIRSLHLPLTTLSPLNTKILKRYRQRVNSESGWEMRQHPASIRYGLLSMFLYLRQREIIDGLIELFIQIVHRLSARAERKLVKTLVGSFQKVHGKTTLLFRIAEAALENPEGRIKEVLYPLAGEGTLKRLLEEYKSSGSTYQQSVHKIIRSSYSGHYRRMVPKIFETLTFESSNKQHRPILDGLEWLRRNKLSNT